MGDPTDAVMAALASTLNLVLDIPVVDGWPEPKPAPVCVIGEADSEPDEAEGSDAWIVTAYINVIISDKAMKRLNEVLRQITDALREFTMNNLVWVSLSVQRKRLADGAARIGTVTVKMEVEDGL